MFFWQDTLGLGSTVIVDQAKHTFTYITVLSGNKLLRLQQVAEILILNFGKLPQSVQDFLLRSHGQSVSEQIIAQQPTEYVCKEAKWSPSPTIGKSQAYENILACRRSQRGKRERGMQVVKDMIGQRVSMMAQKHCSVWIRHWKKCSF